MWKKIDDYIEEQNIFTAEDVVIAGVSGGADSMCLLCVLKKWREKIGFQLIVVHVNHGLRGEAADVEERYVSEICEEWKIPFEAYHIDVKAFAEKEKLSEEEAGRICRRNAFEETMRIWGGTKIALAHHKNDNAETFLFHAARGSRLKGLGGMSPINGSYVRPLLCVQRKEIETYLQQEGVRFFVDASNETDAYSRNRIRNHVIPYLEEQVNEQAVEHMNQSMEYFRRVQEYLERQVEILWRKLVKEVPGEGLLINQQLSQEEDILREMLLKRALGEVAGSEKDIGETHVRILEELLKKQVGRQVDLPYNLQACRIYEGLEIRRKNEKVLEKKTEIEFRLNAGACEEYEYGNYRIQTRIFKRPENTAIPKKTFTKWFDYDIIKCNVCVRPKQAGDQIVVDREGATQKLKRYFVNEKIPSEMRDQIPIIVEGHQILWIVGYRQSMAYQVTEQTTTILEITISGGNEDGRRDQSFNFRGRS